MLARQIDNHDRKPRKREGVTSIALGLLMLIVAGIMLVTGYASSLPGERIAAALAFIGMVTLISGLYKRRQS